MYGRASYGFDPARHQMWHQDSEWIEGVVEAYDYYGSSLATGDFNGDGRDDLAIGVPGENVGDIANAGAVNIMYGRAEGLNYWNDRIIHQDQTSVAGVAQAYDYFGTDVATGDTNNDGYADLGVAIPWGNDSGTANAGAVHVFRGRSDYGLRTDNDYIWHQDVTNIDGAAELNDFFGGEKPQSMDGGVPKLESKPGATKHLFLDFDGGWSSGIYTTYFKLDDQNTANWTERSMIEDIWAAVAEDFAPFNINVTTFLPSAGEVFRVLIGGDGSERQDDPTSGWGPGDYTDASDDNNDVYVYSARIESWYNVGDNLAQRVATTASHEAGHGFGLGHKSTYHAFGALLDEYSDGAGDWTPIMGGNLATDRTIWMEPWVALTVDTHAEGSDDFAVLQSELGLRSDDHASSTGSATNLGSIGGGGMLMDTGIIRTKTDVDTFKFTVTTAGSYNISLAVADVGANLNSTLKLRNSGGTVIATHSPTDSLGASITRTLAVGTYYINVGSEADSVGDVGQFTLRVGPGLVIAIPTEFVFAGVSGGSIGRIGAGDAPVIIDQPTAPLKTLLPVAKGDSPAGAGAPSSQAAIDALMAEWSQAGQKRLQKVSDWFGAHSWSDATDAAFA
jgi:hypothetical protein